MTSLLVAGKQKKEIIGLGKSCSDVDFIHIYNNFQKETGKNNKPT